MNSPTMADSWTPRTDRRVRTILGVRACDSGIQGPENLILAMADYLARRDIRYVIANLWDGDPPSVALHEEATRRGYETHILATRWGMSPAIVPRLAALIRRVQPDIVHTHDVKAEFAAVAALFPRRRPLIGSYYGRLAIHSRFLRIADLSRFLLFRNFDRLLANSSAQAAELRRFYLAENRIRLLPSFVDANAIRPSTSEQRTAARAQLGIDPSQRVLATVAKLALNKGHIYMLRALPAVRTKVPDVLYLIPGEGDAPWRGEGGLRETLEAEARKLDVSHQTRFLGYYPDVTTILHAADVVVSPSLLEGMQVAILEAMAAGLPLVATAIGGTPDAVLDGETGLLVPPRDVDALAGGVISLLENPDRAARMGAAGRRRVESQFTAEVVSDMFMSFCEELFERRR